MFEDNCYTALKIPYGLGSYMSTSTCIAMFNCKLQSFTGPFLVLDSTPEHMLYQLWAEWTF